MCDGLRVSSRECVSFSSQDPHAARSVFKRRGKGEPGRSRYEKKKKDEGKGVSRSIEGAR